MYCLEIVICAEKIQETFLSIYTFICYYSFAIAFSTPLVIEYHTCLFEKYKHILITSASSQLILSSVASDDGGNIKLKCTVDTIHVKMWHKSKKKSCWDSVGSVRNFMIMYCAHYLMHTSTGAMVNLNTPGFPSTIIPTIFILGYVCPSVITWTT